jgi:hypothetical protein
VGGVAGLPELSSQLLLVVLSWRARLTVAAARSRGDVAVKIGLLDADAALADGHYRHSARSIMFRKV